MDDSQTLTLKQDQYSLHRAVSVHGSFRFQDDFEFNRWKQEARESLMENLGLVKKINTRRIPLSSTVLWTSSLSSKVHLSRFIRHIIPNVFPNKNRLKIASFFNINQKTYIYFSNFS